MPKWFLKCGECGKFIGTKVADQYTDYGSGWDLEPPDPVLLCYTCVERNKKKIRETGRMPHHWIPADYEDELAEELGYVWERYGWEKKKEKSNE